MIVGTAGHIDHGKTTLVRALTGVDTDRLPEEKARGISIQLGYAFLDVPVEAGAPTVERIGFIDVPGHERLVHTMLAGATGIDFALLLVAADDGVMPQTREHLAVLSLLGLTAGAVAITKADRVDAARIAEVRAEVAALLAGSSLAGAPVMALSAIGGEGVEALRELLFVSARARTRRQDDDAAFRLAIDRAFTLAGVGTVVTGTVHAGHVAIGDTLALLPSRDGLTGRVRSLHAQNQVVGAATAGQRCAIGIAGIAKEEVERGQWLASPGSDAVTDRFDAEIGLWHDEARALRSGTPVHVHLGAAEVLGSVAVLAALGPFDARSGGTATSAGTVTDIVAPGHRAIVQLVLHTPIGAWHGDRVVLRDASASRTIGGGRVLDPFAPARYRRTPKRLAELAAWSHADAASRLRGLIEVAPFGVSLQRWARAEGRAAGSADTAVPTGALRADAGDGDWALGPAQTATLNDAVLTALRDFHAREPDVMGPEAARLRRLSAPRLPEPLWKAALAALQREGRIATVGAFVHLPEHGLKLSATDERLAQKIAPLLEVDDFEGRWARDLALATGESEVLLRMTLTRLAQRAELHQVVKDLCYAPQTMTRLADIVRTLAARADGDVTAAAFRDATGLGRKRAIQLLEHFDRIGMLRRVGDAHRLRPDTTLFMPTEPNTRTS